MLDIPTLRLALSLVSVVVLALFYLAVYRPTRSLFALWWCVALMCSALSPMLLLFNGTSLQAVANPLSSLVSVLGALSVWFATRSLRGLRPKVWIGFLAMGVVLAGAALDSPDTNIWAGNGLLYIVMTILFGLAAASLLVARRERDSTYDVLHDAQIRGALNVATLAASILTVFYGLRAVLFVFVGETSDLFTTLAGTGPTTLVYLVTLVATTFTVASLGYDQQTRVLRRRIAHDDLTGLLSRAAFLEGARRAVDSLDSGVSDAVLVIADLDHFKQINDTRGHAVGDEVLRAFGAALDKAIGPGELCGRLGGEEFGIVLRAGFDADAEERLMRVSQRFSMLARERETPDVTVSYGVTRITKGAEISDLLARADEAMYSAKEQGRDRVVVAQDSNLD
ncbi:GGDEF domain-containing protein [Demequina flava]|uniref:GGDEF domain-containing protein n=1 Tax=Demequina flava TaxID=1095025 RepID=UPI000785E5ED|nr:GGDEF domain-containing protein [Demequina flava]